MQEASKKWLNFAKEDLRDAEILLQAKSYKNSAWHCHQSIEKLLKAIILEKGKNIKKIHDLIELLKISEIKLSKKLVDFLDEIDTLYLPLCYLDFPLILKIFFKGKMYHGY